MTKEKGKSKKKTIVCIARRLAVLMYTMMRDGTNYESRPFRTCEEELEAITQLALSA